MLLTQAKQGSTWHVHRNQKLLDEEHKEGRRRKKTTHARTCAEAGIPRQHHSNCIKKSSSRACPVDLMSPRQQSRTKTTHTQNWHMVRSHERRKSALVRRQLKRNKKKKPKPPPRGEQGKYFITPFRETN